MEPFLTLSASNRAWPTAALALTVALVAGASRADDAVTPTGKQLANLAYEGIEGRSFVLEKGRYSEGSAQDGAAPRFAVELLEDRILHDDLDGDGVDDAVALLAVTGTRPGTRIWVAAVTGRHGRPATIGSLLVGDLERIRSVRLDDDGRIGFEVVDAGPGDARCCPTRLWTRHYAVVEGELMPVSALMTGRLSLGLLADTRWVLIELAPEDPVPKKLGLTARFDNAKMTGFAGCNDYSAEIDEEPPGSVRFAPVVATRRACKSKILELESRYLERLGQVERYGFRLGRLALTWRDGDRTGTLIFESRPLESGESR